MRWAHYSFGWLVGCGGGMWVCIHTYFVVMFSVATLALDSDFLLVKGA